MKPSAEQLENLLALRRDERPEEGYWQDFLCEFHHRQREQAVMQSAPQAFFSKVSAWISEMSPSKWAYGAGLAYATVTVAFFLIPRNVEVESGSAVPVNYTITETDDSEQLVDLDLSPTAQGHTGEKEF